MTRKFKFRLEAVERVRRAKEQETLRALAYAQAKYQETLQIKMRLMEETETALARREKLANTAQPVLAYQLENEFITGNKQRILQSDQAITRARKFVEKALREVITAKRALKGIELLREKAFLEFKTALRKKEQKEKEEIYTYRHMHGSGLNEVIENDSEWSESA
jgi:flagellar export protein FliJ